MCAQRALRGRDQPNNHHHYIITITIYRYKIKKQKQLQNTLEKAKNDGADERRNSIRNSNTTAGVGASFAHYCAPP